jgi:dethiobiotin synthetase
MSVLLVTGTDTGVGKTLVTASIAAALRARGTSVAVAKPAETGCRREAGGLYAEDAATLAAAVDSREPLDEICPWRFADPLAPALAAERSGAAIDVDALVETLRRRGRAADLLLVEGAGGLLVPLRGRTSYADVAATLAAPVLVVVGSRLGAVNATLLTLEVLAARGIAIAGYVVNRIAPSPDLAAATNGALLRRVTPARCLGEIPWIPDAATLLGALRRGGAPAETARADLAALATTHLDLDALCGFARAPG